MKFDLGFRVGHLLTMKNGEGKVDSDFFVGVRKNKIEIVAPFREEQVDDCARFINAPDQIMIPGLINGHTHLGMSLFRGFEDDLPFDEWLFKRIFPIEAEIVDEEFVEVGVELSALECIRFGTTTVNDMYYFPKVTAQVLDRAGLRGLVAPTFVDFIMPDEKKLGANAILNREERFADFYAHYQNHPRITPALGPHAPYSNSDEQMKLVLELSKKYQVKVHMHVAETKNEVKASLEKYGKTPVQRLFDLGILNENLIAAHGVHLSEIEIELFKKSKASMVYNPDSNLKLSSGIAPIARYRKEGILVGLGSDGAASNNDLSLFGAMDLGTKLQKISNEDNTAMVALDALNLVTYEGAKVLGLQDQIGSIEVGKRADLVLLDTHYPHLQPLYSILSQLVYSYQGLEVNTVVCDGKILMEQGHFKTLNMAKVQLRVSKAKEKVKAALQKMVQ